MHDDAVDFIIAAGDQNDPDLRTDPQLPGQGQAASIDQALKEQRRSDRLWL